MNSSHRSRSPSRGRVLLVEDDEDLREIVAEGLQLEGYEVVQAGTAEEAIQRAAPFRPAIVITDVNMPGMNGLELTDHLLRDYPKPAPTIVVTSGVAAAEVEARRHGAAAVLIKPYEFEELRLTLGALIEGKHPPPAQLEAYADARAQARAARRAMAEAAVNAGFAMDPDYMERATHVSRWLARFYDSATIWVLIPGRDGLIVHLATNPDGANPGAPPAPLATIAENVLETGSTLIVPDVAAQPWLARGPRSTRAIVCVPYRFQGITVGVLCLSAPTPREFAAADIGILEHLAAETSERLALRRRTVLASSWLLARRTFRGIFEIEAMAAAERREGLAVVLFRMEADRRLGALLEHLPARRMQLGQLASDVVALSARAPDRGALEAARAGAALVRSSGGVHASAELFLGAPVSPRANLEALDWAEGLLNATIDDTKDRSHIVVDASPAWVTHND